MNPVPIPPNTVLSDMFQRAMKITIGFAAFNAEFVAPVVNAVLIVVNNDVPKLPNLKSCPVEPLSCLDKPKF